MTGMEFVVWNAAVYWTTFFTIQGGIMSMLVAQKIREDRLKAANHDSKDDGKY